MEINNRLSIFLIFGFCFLSLASCKEKKQMSPKLNLNTNQITVSGISSGGYMAHQFHIAFSDQVVGAALLASGPYGCAEGDLQTALGSCLNNQSELDEIKYITLIKKSAKDKNISNTEHLKNDKVWIYHGTNDSTVSNQVVKAQASLYKKLGAEVVEEYSQSSGHGMPTKSFGVKCDLTKTPFINDCNFDAASTLLSFLKSSENNSAGIKDKEISQGKIITIDQSNYLMAEESNTLADEGYVYVPDYCIKGGECQLHIVFHGCQQNQENIGMDFVENTGYNNWADKNKTVILYPQTTASFVPLNPKACWDWWGYTGEEYQYRSGKQMKHVYQIAMGLAK